MRLSRHATSFKHFVEHRVLGDAVGLGLVAEDEPVAQAGVGDGLHVVGRDVVAAIQPGVARAARSRASVPRGLAPTWIHFASFESLKSPGRRVAAIRATMYFSTGLGDLHGEHFLARIEDGLRRAPCRWSRRGAGVLAADEAEDFALVLVARVADEHVQEEAVHLRFGQRVGAFLLDRVLRRQDEEQIGQLVRRARRR